MSEQLQVKVAEQARIYLDSLQNRKRNPARGNTISAYESYLKNWIEPSLGALNLSEIKNGTLRKFVSDLSDAKLSPASIGGIIQFAKSIVKSAVSPEGEFLYPAVWNNDFIDAPPICARDQEGPILSREALESALERATGQFKALCVLAAGTGLRISEVLAVKRDASSWDPDNAVIRVNAQIYKGLEQDPKTDAGFREVDLAPELQQYLVNYAAKKGNEEYLFATKNGKPLSLPTVYGWAKKAGIPGFHSFRRFRTTHLRSMMIPEDLIQFAIGHSGKSITDRYSKMAQNIELRKKEAERAGLGFDLPKDQNV
jgi:integrase